MMWLLVSLILFVGGVATQDAQLPPTVPQNLTVIETETEEPTKRCFHLPATKCPAIDEFPRCKTVEDAVICCHLKSMFELKEGLAVLNVSAMKSLHIYNFSTHNPFNASFTESHQLENFTMTDSQVKRITGQFHSSITCLNLSGNALEDIDSGALSSLHNLGYLDISHNNLTSLPTVNVLVTNFSLDISGTNKLLCNHIQDIMKQMANESRYLHFSHDNETYCILQQTYNWFNTTERVPLIQLEYQSKLIQECPSEPNYKCICSVQRVQILPGKPPTFSVSVDCSGQQLVDLPKDLPPNTVSLNVSNNNISTLQLLSSDEPAYNDIREFYADNNHISSISILEGSKFMNNFEILSLRDNEIRTIPTYFLSNTLDNVRILKLGHNKLICDCNAAQVTKVWLEANRKHVTDVDDILCENAIVNVINLDQSQVCVYQLVWTDYIYYIIAGEVTLLILLVAKVSYDYWVFKTAGYLPWPASKMPKLPCDWVFET